MEIKSGSEWVDDKSRLDVVVKSTIAAAFEKTKVVYDVFDNTGNYLGYNSCTYDVFLDIMTPKSCSYEDAYKEGYDSGRNQWQDDYGFTVPNNRIQSLEKAAYAKGLKDKEDINKSVKYQEFKKGYDKAKEFYESLHDWDNKEQYEYQSWHKDFNKDCQKLNYRMGYNDGWHDCEASFELGNEFTDSIQEQAYDEGYDQAVDDLIEAGVIGESDEDYSDEDCSEECYSEYEFGDVEDDEGEYCFSKELDKILNGEQEKYKDYPTDTPSMIIRHDIDEDKWRFAFNNSIEKSGGITTNNKEDLVNNPSHYNSDPSGVKCIEITRHRNNNIGNVIKYVWRNGLKDGNSDIQDLEKAAWYLNDEIQRLKGNE